jgi:phosphoglycolate phosphatase
MIGADTLPVRKPDPRPYPRAAVARAGGGEVAGGRILVGDTEGPGTDRKTARAAGRAGGAGRLWPRGRGLICDPACLDVPEAMLAHFDELPALADQIVEAEHVGFGFEQPVRHQPITFFHSLMVTLPNSPALP